MSEEENAGEQQQGEEKEIEEPDVEQEDMYPPKDQLIEETIATL